MKDEKHDGIKAVGQDEGWPTEGYRARHGCGVTWGSARAALGRLDGALPFTFDHAGLPFPDAIGVPADYKKMIWKDLSAMRRGGLGKFEGDCLEGGYGSAEGMAHMLALEPDRDMFSAGFAKACLQATYRFCDGPDPMEGIDQGLLDRKLKAIYQFASGPKQGGKESQAKALAGLWLDLNQSAFPAVCGDGELPDRAAAQYVVFDKACSLMGYDLEFQPADAAQLEAMLSGRADIREDAFARTLGRCMTEQLQAQAGKDAGTDYGANMQKLAGKTAELDAGHGGYDGMEM